MYWGTTQGGGSSSEGLGHWDRKGSTRGLGETLGGCTLGEATGLGGFCMNSGTFSPAEMFELWVTKLKNSVELENFLLTTSSVLTG